MANDIDKTSPHYKGDFGSIYEVNKKYPTGGVAGDFVVIEGWAHYWNADRASWCVNAERDSYWDELITSIIEKFKLVRGATYMGVASLDSVPAKAIGAKMYYFATVAGTYKNFDNLVVPQGINVLYSENGSSWVNTTLLEVAQELGVSTNKVVSQKALNDALNLKANQSSVNEALAKKANIADVDTKFAEEQKRVDDELAKKFDKTSVVQESGEAENKVMSQKAVSDKLSDLADNTEIRNEDGATFKTPFSCLNSNKHLAVEVDSEGRLLSGTLLDGSHYAYNMKSETIDELRERKVDKEEGMSMVEDEVKECFNVIKNGTYPFCLIDNNRRIYLYVDKNGKTHLLGEIESPTIDAINKEISPVLYTTDLDRNVFYTVGDSLCTSGAWQLALCKYRKCSYDVSYGAEVSNMGGTITLDDNFRCGQSRLKRVIEDKNPMILIYENYNDISCLKNIGSKNDVPYFIGDNVIIDTSFDAYEDASNYWTNNATKLLASLEKKVGTVLKIPYNSRNQAGAIYVSGSAKNDGYLALRVNMKDVNITIKKGDNSTEILRKIEEVNFPNCRNEKTENYVKFINNDGSQSWVEFTHTPQIEGVTFSIDYLNATTYLCKTFVSKDINKWNDITYWKSFGEISLWSAYKGLIEYFLKICPTQRLIWFIPRVVFLERNTDSNSYNPKLWYEDGTINIAEYKNNVGENDALANLQKEVCQMYGIECIDLNDMLGVNVVNESSWCNNHDVHPTEMLYNKWGWCISKLIK